MDASRVPLDYRCKTINLLVGNLISGYALASECAFTTRKVLHENMKVYRSAGAIRKTVNGYFHFESTQSHHRNMEFD